MMKHILILLSLIVFVYSVHPDHSERTIKSQDDEGHHLRDHEEKNHKRSTENGNVRTRNGNKHEDELRALVDDSHVRGEDWSGEEDDEPRYGDDGHHEREHEEDDHELFQDKDGNDVLLALEQEMDEMEDIDVAESEDVGGDETVNREDGEEEEDEEEETEESTDRTHGEQRDTEREEVVDDEDIERATGEHEHEAADTEH